MSKISSQVIRPAEYEQYVLEDGRRNWRGHKMDTMALANVYDQVDTAKAARLRQCATTLGYRIDEDGERRLQYAGFCRVRLCPMCSWRRSLKLYSQMSEILDYLADNGKYRYIFVTLTLRNCEGAELSDTLDKLNNAWHNLLDYPEFSHRRKGSMVAGYYRAIEVTHNVIPEDASYNTYHPHIHAIFAVKPSYFKRSRNAYYCDYDRLRAIWRQAAKLDYDPQVSISAIKGSTAAELTKAVAEVCKYSVKSADYLCPLDYDLSVETVAILDKALAGRRFVGMGGVVRQAHKALHLDDADTGDLVHIESDGQPADSVDDNLIWYVWHSGYRQYYFYGCSIFV